VAKILNIFFNKTVTMVFIKILPQAMIWKMQILL